MQTILLKKDAERRVKAGHLWIFNNDIDTQKNPLKNYATGELIIIQAAFGKSIALGYINPHCLLCIRILTNDIHTKIDTNFFIEKIKAATLKRGLIFTSNYYRAIFGESDYVPGVVMDRFNDTIVIQINTAGMENLKQHLIEAAKTVFRPTAILLKCDSTERQMEGLNHYTEIAFGTLPEKITIKENQCEYQISLLTAQKTGWFFDHRFNRACVASYCKNKKVLDVFSYCGAFSLPAAKEANTVIAIDRSQTALDALNHNATLNNLTNIKTICGDALESMQMLLANNALFDVVILDPPALIKKKKDIPAGEKMYQKLNEAALQLLNNHGVLFSASCSMHLSGSDLINIIRKAGISTKKEISILEQCHQAPDHPIHPAITETNYLKGFIVSI